MAAPPQAEYAVGRARRSNSSDRGGPGHAAVDRVALEQRSQYCRTALTGRHEQPELPCDDLGDEPYRFQPVDGSVREASEFDTWGAHDRGAADGQIIGKVQHGAFVEHGSPGVA